MMAMMQNADTIWQHFLSALINHRRRNNCLAPFYAAHSSEQIYFGNTVPVCELKRTKLLNTVLVWPFRGQHYSN